MYFAVVREQKIWIYGKGYAIGFFIYLFIIIILLYLFIYYYYYFFFYYYFFSNCYSIFSRAVGVNVEAMDAYSWPTPGP